MYSIWHFILKLSSHLTLAVLKKKSNFKLALVFLDTYLGDLRFHETF